MKYLWGLFLFVLYISPQTIRAGAREQYLRRVSILLKGVPPKFEDTEPVQNLNDVQYKKYLEKMISQYFESELFEEKMRIRILELLQLKIAPRLSPELYYTNSFYIEGANAFLSTQANNSVLDQYLIDLVKNDKNWNELLTGNRYSINLLGQSSDAELDFYQDVFESGASAGSLAGVITTPRFFERYLSTRSAKNRLLAGAIYKIFLCDDVFVEHKIIANDRKKLIKVSLNHDPEEMQNLFQLKQNTNKNESRLCMNCHSKLDYLGKAFDQSITRPSLEKIQGSLRYVNPDDGSGVNVHFGSIAQMAQAITKQKRFLTCQVDHFWNWFIGSDVKNIKKVQLARYFDQKNRRPKELIKKILVDHFDFYKLRSSEQQAKEVTFANSYYRSMQNFDFYETLRFQFNLSADFIAQCRLQKIDLSSLGLVGTQTGVRTPLTPTMSYYQILYKCAKQLSQLKNPIVKVKFTQKMWENSSIQERRVLTTEVINKIFGHNLYSEERLQNIGDHIFSVVEKLLLKQGQKNNLTLAVNTIASYVVLTPEFLNL